jgi:hypothetical protein
LTNYTFRVVHGNPTIILVVSVQDHRVCSPASRCVAHSLFFANSTDRNVNGRAVVVHDQTGTRVACGLINKDVWNGVTYTSNADGNVDGSVAGSPVYGFEISTDSE